jgi:hypothetical protein
MIEFGTFTVDTSIGLSIVLVIFGALAFFFGKLIEEIKPTKEERTVTYISGTLFLMLYLIFPSLVIYSFRSYFIGYKINLLVAFIVQSTLFLILKNRISIYNIEKHKKKETANKEIINQSERVIDSLKLDNVIKIDVPWISKTVNFAFYKKLSSNVLLFMSLIYCWITANVLFNDHHVIISFYFFMSFIFGLSNIAILYGWGFVKAYEKVNVILDDGVEIVGDLTKINDDFVTLIGENVLHHINKDKIRYIEKSTEIKNMKFPQIDNTVKAINKFRGKK